MPGDGLTGGRGDGGGRGDDGAADAVATSLRVDVATDSATAPIDNGAVSTLGEASCAAT
jgi:hypothetical protein